MSDPVPPEEIERLVGATRRRTKHLAVAKSKTGTVYILHSADCITKHEDLTQCTYSLVLDRGIEFDDWLGYEDQAVEISIYRGRLIPVGTI